MLVYEYPFPKCGFETTDVSVLLAPTFLKIHTSGAHPKTTLHTAPNSTVKIDKVRRSTITVAVPLHDDRHLITFTTPWERYKYWV